MSWPRLKNTIQGYRAVFGFVHIFLESRSRAFTGSKLEQTVQSLHKLWTFDDFSSTMALCPSPQVSIDPYRLLLVISIVIRVLLALLIVITIRIVNRNLIIIDITIGFGNSSPIWVLLTNTILGSAIALATTAAIQQSEVMTLKLHCSILIWPKQLLKWVVMVLLYY